MDEIVKVEPFTWNTNMAGKAIESLDRNQYRIPYPDSQNIWLALQKLDLLERQGARVEHWRGVKLGEEIMKYWKAAEMEGKE